MASGSIPMLRRIFSNSSSLPSSVIFARSAWASRMPFILSGVLKNSLDCLLASVNVAGSLNISGSSTWGGTWDATWDALSSSVSCFELFLAILRVDCVRAMVNVFVSFQVSCRSACQSWLKLSISGNCQGVFGQRGLIQLLIAGLCRSVGQSVWVW